MTTSSDITTSSSVLEIAKRWVRAFEEALDDQPAFGAEIDLRNLAQRVSALEAGSRLSG